MKTKTERENKMNVTLNSTQLAEAAKVAQEIEALQQRLASILGGTVQVTGVTPTAEHVDGRTTRKLSAKARQAIGDAQRRRWAKVHADEAAKTAPATPAPAVVPAATTEQVVGA